MNSFTASETLASSTRAARAAPGQPAVQLDAVSVRYRVPREHIPTIKEYAIQRARRRLDYYEFWALREVTLALEPGDVVGIVGANGAGKSTLLKTVARVLRPTHGRVRVRGRVAPLLELGAGFDLELTGRENVFLNGTLLGFSRADLARRFERIVEFSGLAEFIDAPLRTYSSGMIVRLGFSVATDVAPDVLILDEVFGVGDAEFQIQSADRIQGFRAGGAAILLVSHSLATIQAICTRAIWLENGRIRADGSAEAIARQYTDHLTSAEARRLAGLAPAASQARIGSRAVEIERVRLIGPGGADRTIFETGQPWSVEISYRVHRPAAAPVVGIAVHRQDGVHVTGPNTAAAGLQLPARSGPATVSYEVPALALLEGLYYVSVAVVNPEDTEVYDYRERAYPFRVVNNGGRSAERYGLMSLQGKWQAAAAGPD
jgi:lipopolysaccharide transport system ATP-binding protein